MRSVFLVLALAAAAPAKPAITEAKARAFIDAQEAAWNAGDLARYFSSFSKDASFTDQAYVGDKPPVPYGTSTLPQARAQAHKAFTESSTREAVRIQRIEIAPDGRSARVTLLVGSTIAPKGKSAGPARRLCATRVETLALAGKRLISRGQTDTFVKCRP